MCTYVDAKTNPAIRLAFGWSPTTDRTTKMLAVHEGRVVVRRITVTEFDTEYIVSGTPHYIALRALESIARSDGCDLDAHRIILWALRGPSWRVRLVERQMRIVDFYRRLLRIKPRYDHGI